MRTVSLSAPEVQKKIAKHFVPLKVVIKAGSETFPLDWDAMSGWRKSWDRMKGDGFTGCSVVSPDLKTQLGSTGSAMIWELFDSIAYDAKKFEAMLDRSLLRHAAGQKIKKDPGLGSLKKSLALKKFRNETHRAVAREGRFRFPPKGFSIEKAKEVFRKTGDLKD